ncbi:MAG: hypothetical protein GC180_06945 [Bacteroidetes bacterium]|nr:hypothetical protein [Bacteroidota bacterium]
MCRKSGALFCGGNYPDTTPIRLAVSASFRDFDSVNQPIILCGSCLQALKEYESRFGQELEILMDGAQEVWKVKGLYKLLPFAFNGLEMKP